MKARNRFLIIAGVALLVLFGISIYNTYTVFVTVQLDSAFETAFWLRAWMPFFFDHLAVTIATAAIITFSLALSEFDIKSRDRLMPAIPSVLLILLGIGLVNSLWFGLLGPRVQLRLDRIEYRSEVARTAIDRAAELEAAADYEAAAATLRLYSALVEANDELAGRIERLSVQAAEAEREARRAAADGGLQVPTMPRAFEISDTTIPGLLASAQEALADNQFYTAHYFANLAVAESERAGRRREDALELRAQALNAMEDGISRREEDRERLLYNEKLQAYQLMQQGEDDPLALIRAYYRFQDLQRRLPRDPDVERYYELTRESLRNVTFMADDAREARRLDGRRNVLFVNRREAGMVELIYAERVVQAPQGDFFYDVEVLWIPTDGALDEDELVHLAVEYAHRIDNQLALRAIERLGADGDLEQFIHEPRYLRGSAPDGGPQSEASLPGSGRTLIPLIHPMEDILLAAGGAGALATFSLPELLSAPAALEAVGHSTGLARSELVGRIIRIVGFFVLAFLSISLAWEHRSRYVGRPPVFMLLLVPLLPLALIWLVPLVRSTVDALILVLIGSASTTTAMLVASGVMLLALVLAIAALARQTVSS